MQVPPFKRFLPSFSRLQWSVKNLPDLNQAKLIKLFFFGFWSSQGDQLFFVLDLNQVKLIHFFGFWSSRVDSIFLVLDLNQVELIQFFLFRYWSSRVALNPAVSTCKTQIRFLRKIIQDFEIWRHKNGKKSNAVK